MFYKFKRVISIMLAFVLFSSTLASGAFAQTSGTQGLSQSMAPPRITYTGNAETYTVDRKVNIKCDVKSGAELVSNTCKDIVGNAYTFKIGYNKFSAVAVDKEGNIGNGSTNFTVTVTYDGLMKLTEQFISNKGVANSLTSKLQAAKAADAKGDTNAKEGTLGAFVNEVSAQEGKMLTAEQAKILRDLVGYLSALGAGRTVTNIDSSWKFNYGNVAGAEAGSFDDSAWQNINLPHTWNADDAASANYKRGIGWYRKTIDFDSATYSGKQIYLEFGAASTRADVYVNGVHAGEHLGGFGAFRFDITSLITFDVPTVISVKVNNANDPAIAPLDSGSFDFSLQGGLYRDVSIIATNPIHIDTMDHASPGVYLTATNVSQDSASLNVKTKIVNNSNADKPIKVTAMLKDANGNIVNTIEDSANVPANGSYQFDKNTTVKNPHLWNGLADPYLYHVDVQVTDDKGKTKLDFVTQNLGFRYYRVDKNDGFFLNGKYLDLHGVGYHQDYVNGIGWASTEQDRKSDYTGIMKNMGVNAVRMVHYPHAAWEYDTTDELGYAVWTEIPLVKQFTETADKKNIDPAFEENIKQQLTEMVLQHYNHPSIMFWGMSNEMPNYDTDSAGNYLGGILMTTLSNLAHQLDPTRLTTLATDQGSNDLYYQVPTDLKAINHYSGWYVSDINEFTSYYNGRNAVSTSPLGVSEYGAGANAFQHMDNPTNTDVLPSTSGWHPMEYQSLVHEGDWAQMKKRPEIWGKFIWNIFDFASYKKDEGGQIGINDKGMVTRDRQTKKDAYYFYQSVWTDKPMIKLTSEGFENRPHSIPVVKAYSNCDEVTLYVDGVKKGTVKRSSLKDSQNDTVFTWSNVDIGLGEHTIRVEGTKNGKTVSDKAKWNGILGNDTRVTSEKYLVLESSPFDSKGKPHSPMPDSKIEAPGEAATLAEYLKNINLPFGSTVKLYQKDGVTLVSKDTPIAPDMKLVVTSEDGKNKRVYNLFIRNIALLKPVSASSVKGGSQYGSFVTDGITDNNTATGVWAPFRDASSNYSFPSWVITDLGDVYNLSAIKNYFVENGKSFGYKIYAGNELNGKDWKDESSELDLKDGGTLIVDKDSNTDKSGLYVDQFSSAAPVTARYIKVVMTKMDGSSAPTKTQPGIREIEVYGYKLTTSYPIDRETKAIKVPSSTTVNKALSNISITGNVKGIAFTDQGKALIGTDLLTNGSILEITDYNGSSVNYVIYVDGSTIPVEKVTLDAEKVTLNVGDTKQLTAAVTPSFATNKDLTWSSSDESIVKVKNGLIEAVGEGKAVITVTSVDQNKTAACEVNVQRVIQGDGPFAVLNDTMTEGTTRDLEVDFSINPEDKRPNDANTDGIRNTSVTINLPKGISANGDDEVSIIGQDRIKLNDTAGFETIKKNGTDVVGASKSAPTAVISNGGQTITFTGLDLLPNNGVDIQLFLKNKVVPSFGDYEFSASYTPNGRNRVVLKNAPFHSVKTVTDFHRVIDTSLTYKETGETYNSLSLNWTAPAGAKGVAIKQTTDGINWTDAVLDKPITASSTSAHISNLPSNKLYQFKLVVTGGTNAGDSNIAKFYTGKFDVKTYGHAAGDGLTDDTKAIQKSIDDAAATGGGMVLFSKGDYLTGTIHLRSNVYLYLDSDATILAKLHGIDTPEPYYLASPYIPYTPDNSKSGPYGGNNNAQDIGHSFFNDALFVGLRIDNFKILGSGVIDGNGAITAQDANKGDTPIIDVNQNTVNNFNESFDLGDKLISLKLSTNFELGGHIENPTNNLPDDITNDGPTINPQTGKYYDEGDTNNPVIPYANYNPNLNSDPKGIPDALHFRRGGHFVLLATGVDHMNLHDIYYLNGTAKNKNGIESALSYGQRQRDLFDLMSDNHVTVKNIYTAVQTDDIVKLGSDFSLGFRRASSDFLVDNIVGRTECNLFKIGSETAADTSDIHVTNLHGYGVYKAGFNINENDGATISNVTLDGAIFTNTSIPISINLTGRNRNGGDSGKASTRPIGSIKNVRVNNVTHIGQDYFGLVGTHINNMGPAVVVGYKNASSVRDITLNNIKFIQKGGQPYSNTSIVPKYELGNNYDPGGYFNNGSPVYGLLVKYATNVVVNNLTTEFQNNDDRYAVYVDESDKVSIHNASLEKGSDPSAASIAVMKTNNFEFTNVKYKTGEGMEVAIPDVSPAVNITNSQVNRVVYPAPAPASGDKSSTEIKEASDHEHLVNVDTGQSAIDLTNRTITAIVGTTDTDLKNEITAADNGSQQIYEFTDSSHNKKSGVLKSGDLLLVTSEDHSKTTEYKIVIQTTIQGEGSNSPNLQFVGLKTFAVSGKASTSTDSNPLMGFGIFQQITGATAPGSYLEYELKNIPEGTYSVEVTSKKKAARGTMTLYVDGETQPTLNPIDESVSGSATVYDSIKAGTVTITGAGNHTFRFLVTGYNQTNNPSGSGNSLYDVNIGYFRLTPIN
ncbi:glycoside hydrolase family 2 TIM barrel-domain containing protein [Neobacillus sp. 114]|uniref:glycoside hydrolase family 2 TIM barrel-domain containing protein n=1 Tax=Neobacillus sp. 114 TaxID=3048535 RepID=UPI0024C24208|nr:glycoside hydrolase family 2 TIM barrel-domain containing protein [Neobacillus sp. 114]